MSDEFLPPTFLRTTLYTNQLIGNVIVNGTVFMSSNLTATYFIGNGALLTGVTSTLPTTANIDIDGNVTATGNISAEYFIGNGALLSGINVAFPSIANIDITGNVIGAYANVANIIAVQGNVGNVTFVDGNVSADYFIGNGSLLTGIATYTLPGNANIDIIGNVIGAYANVANIIAIQGNVGNVTFVGGNIVAGGQINTLGNVVAPFFIGNGSQLTGVASALPGVIAEDIVGNIIGAYANVANIIAVQGNVGNVRMLGGNLTMSGQINTLGNVVAPFFIGNGSQLTGIAAALPGVIAEDIVGNIIGAYANVANIIAVQGNVGNVFLSGGNVTAGNLSGQSVFANLITFGVNANVGKMTGLYCVAMNGNDSTADGSDVKPFLTIQAAHDRALAEYPPVPSAAIAKQVEIRVAAGTFESPVTITRYNTVIRGAGSLFGRGMYTSIGQVTVNCANAGYVSTNTVCLDRVLCLNGVTNTGSGAYTLTIDSCFLTANNASLLTSENDKAYVFVNDTFLSASLAGGNTYVRATGNLLNFYDCTVQAPTGVASGGQFINVGGNCAITLERCFVNVTSSTNAVIKATSGVPSAASGFKINLTNSYLQNLGGPGVDFGTTNTAGSFIRNTNAIVPGAGLFVGNGTAYYNQLIILPGTSNTKASTVTVLPYTLF